LEERGTQYYGTQYLFLCLIESKNIETLSQNIFIVSRATETLVDNDDKTAVVQRRDTKLAAITLVCSQGHSIGTTRSHDLQEGTLACQGASADHSKISVRGTH
jgi:hypothetical protein